MDMDDQRFSGAAAGFDSRGVSHPVVGVDHVKVVADGDLAGDEGIPADLLEKGRAIGTGKGYGSRFGDFHKPGSFRVGAAFKCPELLRGLVGKEGGVDPDLFRDCFPCLFFDTPGIDHGNLVGAHQADAGGFLVAPGAGHHEEEAHTAHLRQPPGQPATGRTESTGNVRGKFPSKHEYPHT